MSRLYAAFDLHSSSSYLGIIDEEGKRLLARKVGNEEEQILMALRPYSKRIAGIAVESTYNWYWLVDLLMDHGYKVHLANPSQMPQYSGIKHKDDRHDAFWLAEMLRLKVLPEGYIYPKATRGIRDLLRKRTHLVRLRTSLIINLQHTVTRSCGSKVSVSDIKRVRENPVLALLEGDVNVLMAGTISTDTIHYISKQIRKIEKAVEGKVTLLPEYSFLLTIPGVGTILALTIMLETGPISRFPTVGDYVSYCRKVDSKWVSNEKRKGKGNTKNGNRYLAWAYSEAAEHARRFDKKAAVFYLRKEHRENFMVAHQALSHKLARAAYIIMRDRVPFQAEKLFG